MGDTENESTEVAEVDPLSVLREYTTNNKEIVERDNQIIFGEISWPKDTKTNYMTHHPKHKPTPPEKEFYTLESLLFLLKNAQLSHPVYCRKSGAENIPPVRRPDRKDVLDYLNGKIPSPDSAKIDKSVSPAIPTAVKRAAEDTVENEAKKQCLEDIQARVDTAENGSVTV